MKMSKVKVRMHGHHNSDFRDVTFSFVDRGNKKANYAQALKLAISREAQWTGWYDNELRGLEKEVSAAIDKLLVKGGETIIFGFNYDEEDEPTKVSNHVGLVVWYETSKYCDNGINVGFGMAYNRERKVVLNDSDKYDNRWVSIVASKKK